MGRVNIRDTVINYAGGPAGPGCCTVVFVHGAGGNHLKWLYQLKFLNGPHRGIALDLPGHGESGGVPSDRISDYRDLLREFVHALGIERPVIAGHSMGGAIAIDYAIRYPDELDGLVLVGTGGRLRVAPEWLESLERGAFEPKYVRWAYSPAAPEELVLKGIEEAAKTPPRVRLKDLTACDRFDVLGVVGSIKTPTLIVCGEDDLLTPPKYSRFLADSIQGSRLRIIPGAGHMVMIEQPDEVNRALAEFLEGLPGNK